MEITHMMCHADIPEFMKLLGQFTGDENKRLSMTLANLVGRSVFRYMQEPQKRRSFDLSQYDDELVRCQTTMKQLKVASTPDQ